MKEIALLLVVFAALAGRAEQGPENIGQRYCESLHSGDFTTFKNLFSEDHRKLIDEESFLLVRPKCSVLLASRHYVTIRYENWVGLYVEWTQSAPEETGTLYILPDGTIKYDPIFLSHPATILRRMVMGLGAEYLDSRECAAGILKKWGVPLFGFVPTAPREEREESFNRCMQWLAENESTFDQGEHKLPISPVDLERARREHNLL